MEKNIFIISHKQSCFQRFVRDITDDLKLFVFLLAVLCVFRALFIADFANVLEKGTPLADIIGTMFLGLRISLKTSAAFIIPTFVFCTLLRQIFCFWPSSKIRLFIGGAEITALSLLFQTRIPYYREFHNAFDPFIFNTFHDDVGAIADTAIKQYQAPWRILAALLVAAVFIYLLKKFLDWKLFDFENVAHKGLAVAAIIIFIPVFAVFMRHGGSFTYNGSVYWKNAARFSQHLLNEAVLDDVQALYRASRIYKYTSGGDNLKFSAADVRKSIELLTGKPYTADTLEPFLLKHAQGVKNPPRHIFIIIGETYMLWPLLDEYKYLHIADGMENIIARKNAILIKNFLPAANGTMFGITGVVLGMPDLSIYTASRPSAAKPYETALSVQLKKLGYQTRFFYGGYPSWENVGSFMDAQQFDKSYYKADFKGGKGNAWGIEDKYLFEGIEKIFKDDKPSFNVIMTSSNHPPLTVDLSKEPGVKTAEQTAKTLPPSLAKDKDLINKLRHFEYADEYIASFINDMYKKYPDSLFILTGDHAQRWYLNQNPDIFETVAVPLVLYGKGINKNEVKGVLSGSHKDIAATVMELVSPKDYSYYALGENILNGGVLGLHNVYWISGDNMGDINNPKVSLNVEGAACSSAAVKKADQRAKALRQIAWWRIMKGLSLKD